jgi:hypothetical protein
MTALQKKYYRSFLLRDTSIFDAKSKNRLLNTLTQVGMSLSSPFSMCSSASARVNHPFASSLWVSCHCLATCLTVLSQSRLRSGIISSKHQAKWCSWMHCCRTCSIEATASLCSHKSRACWTLCRCVLFLISWLNAQDYLSYREFRYERSLNWVH